MDYEPEELIQDMVTILPREIVEKIIDYVIEIQYYDDLVTCEICGRMWDGNAQCFPCDFE